MNQVICVIGTRPEAIKMAPVVHALEALGIDAPVLATAQHRDLLDPMLAAFNLRPRWDLDLMRPRQTLAEFTGMLVPLLDKLFQENRPKVVLAQGDTTTVFCTALASFYAGIPFGHVEAGLRSGDLGAPFPEEGLRRMTAPVTRFHFAPTEGARQTLLRENVDPAWIHMVGNTVIDSLLQTAERADLPRPQGVPVSTHGERIILVTVHRRENFGEPLARILGSLADFARRHPDTRLVYPVHPNPNVREPAVRLLGGIPNIHLVEPLDYLSMVALLKQSYAAFSDSGGIQEEGPALGVPVLVFRDKTERPEAVEVGSVRLVGTDPLRFFEESESLMTRPEHHADMAKPRFPFGDGKAGARIARVLSEYLGA